MRCRFQGQSTSASYGICAASCRRCEIERVQIALPPPRKNELVRPRLSVPPSDGARRTPADDPVEDVPSFFSLDSAIIGGPVS